MKAAQLRRACGWWGCIEPGPTTSSTERSRATKRQWKPLAHIAKSLHDPGDADRPKGGGHVNVVASLARLQALRNNGSRAQSWNLVGTGNTRNLRTKTLAALQPCLAGDEPCATRAPAAPQPRLVGPPRATRALAALQPRLVGPPKPSPLSSVYSSLIRSPAP